MNLKSCCLAMVAMLAAMGSFQLVLGQNNSVQKPSISEKIGVVKGVVNIIDHPTLGRTLCRNCRIAFESIECPDSIVLITTNDEGEYRLGLGKGRYRVVSEDVTPEGSIRSLLAPGQKELIDIRSLTGTLTFNIGISLGKE